MSSDRILSCVFYKYNSLDLTNTVQLLKTAEKYTGVGEM